MRDDPPRPINPPERCEECGWQAASVSIENAETIVSDLGRRFRSVLGNSTSDPNDPIRRRPTADIWSALEYTAHVRDVIAVWSVALHRLLTEDGPVLTRPDPSIADQAAVAGHYSALDPTVTLNELAENANRMARKVASISANQWNQAIFLGDEEMTAIAIVRKVAHEGKHHLLDVRRSLRAAVPLGARELFRHSGSGGAGQLVSRLGDVCLSLTNRR